MTAAQYRIGTDPANPRYGPNRALICNALALTKRANLMSREKKLAPGSPAHLARVRPQQKGKKQPPEFSRKQSSRMRGQRKPEWTKPVADIEFVWPWLIENKSIEEVAKIAAFSQGGVWQRLKTIIGVPVRKTLPELIELGAAELAGRILQECGTDDAKLKTRLARLCEERGARATMLLLPHMRAWLGRRSNESKLAPADLARVFLADRKGWMPRRSRPRSDKPGPDKTPDEKTVWFSEGRKVEELIANGELQSTARHTVANAGHRAYGTIEQYHKWYRAWRKAHPHGGNPE